MYVCTYRFQSIIQYKKCVNVNEYRLFQRYVKKYNCYLTRKLRFWFSLRKIRFRNAIEFHFNCNFPLRSIIIQAIAIKVYYNDNTRLKLIKTCYSLQIFRFVLFLSWFKKNGYIVSKVYRSRLICSFNFPICNV